MNGTDLRELLYAQRKANSLGMRINPSGDFLEVSSCKKHYGVFVSTQVILGFLCGYEAGLSEGRCEVTKEDYEDEDRQAMPLPPDES